MGDTSNSHSTRLDASSLWESLVYVEAWSEARVSPSGQASQHAKNTRTVFVS